MFVKTIITQRLNGLRAQYTPQRTSLWCLHSKDMGEEEVWENGICVCGGVCVRAKNSMVFNELVNGKEEITAACKSLSIYWFPFVLEIELFYTGCGGWGALKMDIYIISHTQIYDNTSYTNRVKVRIKYILFTILMNVARCTLFVLASDWLKKACKSSNAPKIVLNAICTGPFFILQSYFTDSTAASLNLCDPNTWIGSLKHQKCTCLHHILWYTLTYRL